MEKFGLFIQNYQHFYRSCPNRQLSPPKPALRKRRSMVPRTDNTPKTARITRSSTFNTGSSRPEVARVSRKVTLRRSTQQQMLDTH